MTVVSTLGVLASVMGTLMATAPLLQLHRIRRRQSAEDVSKAFIAVVCCGSASWLAYGIALGNPFMIVPNVIGVAANGATLLVAYRLTRRTRTRVEGRLGRPHGPTSPGRRRARRHHRSSARRPRVTSRRR